MIFALWSLLIFLMIALLVVLVLILLTFGMGVSDAKENNGYEIYTLRLWALVYHWGWSIGQRRRKEKIVWGRVYQDRAMSVKNKKKELEDI